MVPYGIEYNGIRFLPDRVELVSAGSPVAVVKREDIRGITARYTFQSERPLLQMVLGILLLMALLWPLGELVTALRFGGTIYIASYIYALFPASLGAYLVWNSLKRAQVLMVELDHTQRKFPFRKKAERQVLVTFLQEASKLGYAIDMTSVNGLFEPHSLRDAWRSS